MNDQKLTESLELLAETFRELESEPKSRVLKAALSKAYEVSFEYAWKAFKKKADQSGLEVYSPRDAIKAAVQLNLIDDLELWEKFLNVRNLSVHDYIGATEKEFLNTAQEFLKAMKTFQKS